MADEPAAEVVEEAPAALSDTDVAALAAGLEAPDAEPKEPAEGEDKPEVAAKPPEPKAEEAKPADPETVKLRQLGAKMARRAQKLDQREAAAKQLEDAAKFAQQLQHLSRTDKLAALKALGINEDEIVDAVLARQPGNEKKPPTVEEQLAEMRAKLDARDKADEAARAAQAQNTMLQRFQDEQFAQINAAPGLSRVKASVDLQRHVIIEMGRYHALHGVIPDPVETAKWVEAAVRAKELIDQDDSPATVTPKKNQTPPTSKAKNTAAPSPSLTDRISDTPVGEDDLPDDPDERLKVAWARLNA